MARRSPGNTCFDGGVWQHIDTFRTLFAQAMTFNPTGRTATPKEIGRGILVLVSTASNFTTGTNLVIDGAADTGSPALREALGEPPTVPDKAWPRLSKPVYDAAFCPISITRISTPYPSGTDAMPSAA